MCTKWNTRCVLLEFSPVLFFVFFNVASLISLTHATCLSGWGWWWFHILMQQISHQELVYFQELACMESLVFLFTALTKHVVRRVSKHGMIVAHRFCHMSLFSEERGFHALRDGLQVALLSACSQNWQDVWAQPLVSQINDISSGSMVACQRRPWTHWCLCVSHSCFIFNCWPEWKHNILSLPHGHVMKWAHKGFSILFLKWTTGRPQRFFCKW